MPSYYSRVTGDLEAGKLAKSEDINLIQSHVSTGIANMIVDLFGSAFILGHDEDALTLEPTPLLVDQKNTENKDENSAWASIHHIYYRQKFRTTKSEIHSIKIDLINNTEFPVTVQAEIRDIDFNIIAEANYNLKPQLNTTSEFVTAEFVFNQQHLPIGEYYFVIRPIDLSKIDFDKYVQSGQTLEVQEIDPINSFRVRIDQKGQYAHALQASEDGDQWLNASQLPSAVSSWDPEDMAVIPPNYDLYFEQVFSEGNTYIIHNPTTAIINGEKVYPLDTHVSINGPSRYGDRIDLVYMTNDGQINVKEGLVHDTNAQKPTLSSLTSSQDVKDSLREIDTQDVDYPTKIGALKIAYITVYKNSVTSWVCPTCKEENPGVLSECYVCKTKYSNGMNKIPLVEQNDDNYITRNRDILERMRRVEKKTNYIMDRNSPSRIKYLCTLDPIINNKDIKDPEATRNIVATTNSDGETVYVPQTGYDIKQLYWSIREQSGLKAQTITNIIKGTLTGYNLTKKYGDKTKNYVVNLKDPDTMDALIGKGIDITINGVKYTRTTNNNGDATLNINLPAGTYTATASYGDAVISNTVVVLPEDATMPEEDNTSNVSTVKETRISTTGIKINGKVISSNVRTGDDAFYKDGVVVDTEKGIIELGKTEYDDNTYAKTESLNNEKKKIKNYEVSYTIHKNNDNEYNSEYPVLNINLPTDCRIKSITPDITYFKNIESFGIILFKNDIVFKEKSSMRYAYQKKFVDDETFPNMFKSELVSLSEIGGTNNVKKLDTPHTFDTQTNGEDLYLPAGKYSILIYGKIMEGQTEGVIKIREYETNGLTDKYGVSTKCLGSVNPSSIYLETNNITNKSWDCILEKKNDTYFDRGIIISQGVSVGGRIRACSVSKNTEIPNGCNISTYVSNNGGKTWVNADSGSVTFSGTGNTFKWKFVLESNGETTPRIKFDENKMWAMVFNIGISSEYIEYEDYQQCFETQLIDAERTTAFLLQQPVYKHFAEWEFARIWMDDPNNLSKIDICTSNDETPTHLGILKKYWPSTMFFNTIFSDLTLNDFEKTSVDYDDYVSPVEYDENNFRFDYDEDYTYNYNVGEIVARHEDIGDINDPPLSYIEYNIIRDDVDYLYSNNWATSWDEIASKEKVTTQTKVYSEYKEAIYIPDNKNTYWYNKTSDPIHYNTNDIIIGKSWAHGLNISEGYTSITLDIYPTLKNQPGNGDLSNINIPVICYNDKKEVVFRRINKSAIPQDLHISEYKRIIPAGTLEVVVALNPNGLVSDETATYGKAYTINKDLISNEYNVVNIDITEDVYAYGNIKSIGIRFKNTEKNENAYVFRSMPNAHDSIGLGTIRLHGYNIRPIIPYDSTVSFNWKPLYANRNGLSGGYTDEEQKVWGEFRMNTPGYIHDTQQEFHNRVPVDIYTTQNTYDFQIESVNPDMPKKTDSTVSTSYLKIGNICYPNENPAFSNEVLNTKENTISFTYNNQPYTTPIDFTGTVFELTTDTGNLFAINTETPFSTYNTIVISYTLDTLVGIGDETVASKDSNIHYHRTWNENWMSVGSFHKGELFIDLYEDQELTKDSEPVESFALPAWGRSCAHSESTNKTITAIFKKRSNAKAIRWVVLRRENPLGKKLDNINFNLINMALYTSKKLPALGPKILMRIYPHSLTATNVPRIRKYGVVYKLT